MISVGIDKKFEKVIFPQLYCLYLFRNKTNHDPSISQTQDSIKCTVNLDMHLNTVSLTVSKIVKNIYKCSGVGSSPML